MAASGWEGLEAAQSQLGASVNQASAAEEIEKRRIAALVARVLGDEDGKAFLDLLLRKTIFRSPNDWERGAQTAEAYAIAKAKREGQNDIVFWLLSLLQVHTQNKEAGSDPQ